MMAKLWNVCWYGCPDPGVAQQPLWNIFEVLCLWSDGHILYQESSFWKGCVCAFNQNSFDWYNVYCKCKLTPHCFSCMSPLWGENLNCMYTLINRDLLILRFQIKLQNRAMSTKSAGAKNLLKVKSLSPSGSQQSPGPLGPSHAGHLGARREGGCHHKGEQVGWRLPPPHAADWVKGCLWCDEGWDCTKDSGGERGHWDPSACPKGPWCDEASKMVAVPAICLQNQPPASSSCLLLVNGSVLRGQ